MALNYKLYQSNRKDDTKGKWYARVTHASTIDTNGLAAIMQANCTVKRSDILAVIAELVEVMTRTPSGYASMASAPSSWASTPRPPTMPRTSACRATS